MSLTPRQTIVSLLEREELSACNLASILLLPPREVEEHLHHLQKSLKNRLKISPAQCRQCGFTLSGSRYLDAPGRCPRCRQNQVESP